MEIHDFDPVISRAGDDYILGSGVPTGGTVADFRSRKAEVYPLSIFEPQPLVFVQKGMRERLIREFEVDGVSYQLARPLMVDIYLEDNMITCANEDLHLYGCGVTVKEAIKELEEILVTLYRSYKETPLENLTEDAKKLRQELYQLFEHPYESPEEYSLYISTRLSDSATSFTSKSGSFFASYTPQMTYISIPDTSTEEYVIVA